MSKRLSSIYFYTDSDLFELFEPEKRRFKKETLLKIARSKGIILSKEDDRDEICGYLSRLNWSWVEIERLCSYIESPQRSKKETSFRVETETEIGRNFLEEYVEKAKELRIEKYDEDWTFTKKSNGDLKVVVQHPEMDLKKSKVRQMKDEELVIEISHSPEGFSIRHLLRKEPRKFRRQ